MNENKYIANDGLNLKNFNIKVKIEIHLGTSDTNVIELDVPPSATSFAKPFIVEDKEGKYLEYVANTNMFLRTKTRFKMEKPFTRKNNEENEIASITVELLKNKDKIQINPNEELYGVVETKLDDDVLSSDNNRGGKEASNEQIHHQDELYNVEKVELDDDIFSVEFNHGDSESNHEENPLENPKSFVQEELNSADEVDDDSNDIVANSVYESDHNFDGLYKRGDSRNSSQSSGDSDSNPLENSKNFLQQVPNRDDEINDDNHDIVSIIADEINDDSGGIPIPGDNQSSDIKQIFPMPNGLPCTKKVPLPRYCEKCNKWFRRPGRLLKHLEVHKKKQSQLYKCKICPGVFTGEQRHEHKTYRIEVEGQGTSYKNMEKKFQCTMCTKKFARRVHLNSHLQIHLNIKNFSCGQCSKNFYTKGGLGRHMHKHSGAKCRFCNEMFKHGAVLEAHERTHTGEKPFICELCGKGFSLLTGLQYHLRRHNNDKPFECDICGKKFYTNSNLRKHSKTHRIN